ncbi:MAG: YfhO family protein [Clostridia bacterium]|nr:YfhO family protein [Clostridia bacterium]
MKNKIQNFFKVNRYVFMAFFLPVCILVFVFALTGIYPFGSQQLAIIDMYHQYIPFLSELQCRLQGGGSLFYSWNSGGGCNFWCLLSYYGASPLNLLLVFFPKSLIVEAVSVILLIKIGLSGSFMYIYLKNVYNPVELLADRKAGLKTVLFSSMYALSSFTIGYYWCIMWLDAVMLLPLLMLGLNRLIKDGRMALYTVTLAIIVFSNYYIAIMVCIFVLAYYPVCYFITVRNRGAKACLFTTLKAVGASLLGIAMSAVMLLPTYISMQNAYYFSSSMPEEWKLYYDALDVINQLFPVAHLTYLDGLPNLCCGFLVTVMLACYFMSREISYREKALNGAFLVLMYLSLNVNKLDFVWHGMHFPNQLPHRFSFVICFVLVAMGYRAFNRLHDIRQSRIFGLFVLIGGYYILAQKILTNAVDNMNMFMYYGLALTTAYGILFGLYKRQKLTRRPFMVLLAVVVAAELCVSTGMYFDTMGNSSRETYNENKASVTRLAKYAGEEGGATADGGNGRFARMEIDDPLIHNCPAFYHYRGMGQFSSTLNSNTTTLMERIGLEGHPGSNRFNFNETSPVTSCITNVDYLIAKNRKLNDPDYQFIKMDGDSRLYASNYPLSIGYVLPDSIRTWKPYDANPFVNLDDYVRAATSGKVEKVFVNMGQGEVTGANTSAAYVSDSEIESTLRDPSASGSVHVTYTAETAAKYYVYVAADYAEDIYIECEDSPEDIAVQADCGSILNIGVMEKGKTFKIKVDFESGRAGRVTCYVCTLDEEAWSKAYSMISSNLMTVTNATDTCLKGTVDAGLGGVFVTSIPYEDGWSMKIDGRKTEITELTGDCWISAGLSAGTHEIELSFRPKGFMNGLLITIASILVLIAATTLPTVIRRHRFLKEESDYSKE